MAWNLKETISQTLSEISDIFNVKSSLNDNENPSDNVQNDFHTIEENSYINPYLRESVYALALIIKVISNHSLSDNILELEQQLDKLIHIKYQNLVEELKLQQDKKLLPLQEDLREALTFPITHQKTIVAVGGSFSAGKSLFINSLLKSYTLPIGITPTTSIPTYIISSQDVIVKAYNQYRHLSTIDENAFAVLTHEFSEKHDIKLGHIIKAMLFGTPTFPYKNIALLDTPGYTNDTIDKNIARKQLQKADRIIWLINAEKGIIPLDDIRFLKSLNHKQPILFILTKSDTQLPEQISDIKRLIQRTLKKHRIPIFDVITYSSLDVMEGLKTSLTLEDIKEIVQDEAMALEIWKYLRNNNLILSNNEIAQKVINKFSIAKKEEEIDLFQNANFSYLDAEIVVRRIFTDIFWIENNLSLKEFLENANDIHKEFSIPEKFDAIFQKHIEYHHSSIKQQQKSIELVNNCLFEEKQSNIETIEFLKNINKASQNIIDNAQTAIDKFNKLKSEFQQVVKSISQKINK